MCRKNVPVLKIGNLEICPPIIQGGMAVKISEINLASAVADTGCAGIIAVAGLVEDVNFFSKELEKRNADELRKTIRQARKNTKGIIGVNIMVALSNYDDLVKTAIEEDVDMIISGAGLPMNLPKDLNGKDVKLIPIVSSVRTFNMICKRWQKRYNKLPDAVVVEGPKAGGHLGYTYESLEENTTQTLDEIVTEVILAANAFKPKIPVIAAGGIFDGKDIAHFLKMGAAGVQMGTRFVCTDECDAHINFKMAYINAKPGDITIIKSPVGLPGRVIKNKFVEKIQSGKTIPFNCRYKCLKSCNPKEAPYCIAKVLTNAQIGKMDECFAFAGSNAYKCTEIIPVKELVEKLSEELAIEIEHQSHTLA